MGGYTIPSTYTVSALCANYAYVFKNNRSKSYCWLYTFILCSTRPARTLVEHVENTSGTLKDNDSRLTNEGFGVLWSARFGFERCNPLFQGGDILHEFCEYVVHLWRCVRRRFYTHTFCGGVQRRCGTFVEYLRGATFHRTRTFGRQIIFSRCTTFHDLRIIYNYFLHHYIAVSFCLSDISASQ